MYPQPQATLRPLSSLLNLSSLSLHHTPALDLSPLQCLSELYYLDVRNSRLPPKFQMEISGATDVGAFLQSLITPVTRLAETSVKNKLRGTNIGTVQLTSPQITATGVSCATVTETGSTLNNLQHENVPATTSNQILYSIVVKNLPFRITKDELRTVCPSVGNCMVIRIIRPSNNSSAHAFVNYTSEQSRNDAITQINGHLFDGKTCRVAISKGKVSKSNTTTR
ncbi:hypothetical protein RCL1_006917 [Eukaryota sp. TZLM3-RCL]